MTEKDKKGREKYRNLESGEIIEKEDLNVLGKYPEPIDFTGKPTIMTKHVWLDSEINALLLDYEFLPCGLSNDSRHLYSAYYCRINKLG